MGASQDVHKDQVEVDMAFQEVDHQATYTVQETFLVAVGPSVASSFPAVGPS